jgi:hypothetical protein
MSKVPYRIGEIDLNNICYSDIKSNNKKTIVYLKYADNIKFKNIVFQTPSFLSNNLVQFKNDIYELDVPLIGKDDKINKFIKFINELDKKIIMDAKNNNKWFQNFADMKTMKFQKTIRESTESSNKNGVIRLKLLKTNDFETFVQMNNSRINIEEIVKDCWLKCILEIYAIWINKNGFGLFIRPILLSFKPCMKINYNYKLLDDSDGEENIDEVQIDTVVDTSIFIRSENEITSSVLELPKNKKSSDEKSSSSSSSVKEFKKDHGLNSTTSSDN